MSKSFISDLNRLVLILAALFFSYDLIDDLTEGSSWIHFFIEFVIFTLVLVVLFSEMLIAARLRHELSEHTAQLSRLQDDFSNKIKKQLVNWRLTESESEIAWLVIKGFSFKEIGRLRGVKEKTVRQQATRIYAKSGVDSRNDLTAVFIEDLLNPDT